jgi:hypothetical protein
MATTTQIDLIRKSPGNLSGLPLDLTVNAGVINSGDLCYWTGIGVASLGTGLTLTQALIAKLGRILGVSRDTNPLTAGGIINPIETVGIHRNGAFLFNTTAADVYTNLAEVTVGVDAQTIALTGTAGPPSNSAGLFVAGVVAGGTLTLGNHVATMTYLTPGGETGPGTPSGAIAATAGQGLIYDFDNAQAVVIPAWAIGFNVYIDGVFAATYFAAPVADANITGPSASTDKLAPASSSLAIGRVFIPQTNISPAGPAPVSILGAAGVKIPVILYAPWPQQLAL